MSKNTLLFQRHQFRDDWWVVKVSKGNGGRDIWIVNPDNFQQVLPNLHIKEGMHVKDRRT